MLREGAIDCILVLSGIGFIVISQWWESCWEGT